MSSSEEESNEIYDSPEIHSLRTSLSFRNVIRNERFATYKSLIVYFHFTSPYYNFVPKYYNTKVITINTENKTKLQQQIQQALMSLTRQTVKQHILICSASILQDDEHGLDLKTVQGINGKDIDVLKAYNKCLAEYSKFNIIHNNITIFHCVIGETTKFHRLNRYIPRLKTVCMKSSKIPVFNKIVNFCSLRSNQQLSTGDLFFQNKPDMRQPECTYKILPFFRKNQKWWELVDTDDLSYTKGRLYQMSGTCWLHCVINLIILTPLGDEGRHLPHIIQAVKMKFADIATAKRDKTVRELLFAFFRNMLLRNTLPKNSDGDILLPIAARIKGLVFENNENFFRDIDYGNGVLSIHNTTLVIFKLFLGDRLLTDISGEVKITSLLHLPETILLKYILFSGNFKLAPKTLDTNNGIYDLFGSIISVKFDSTSRHAVCGIIKRGQECIVDSHHIVTVDTWSDVSKCNYKTDVYLSNCVYVHRE